MAKTKKIVKKSRITPEVPASDLKVVRYENLNDGDAFLMSGDLWIKSEQDDQIAVNLANGDFDCCLCDNIVEPVDITINWKRRA